MNTEEFRQFCLSLPDVTEKMPFQKFRAAENILAFYVGKHIFCFYDIEKFDECTVKCPPAQIATLEEKYKGVTDPYNLSHKYWIGIRFNSDVPDQELKNLVKQSYEIVKNPALSQAWQDHPKQ